MTAAAAAGSASTSRGSRDARCARPLRPRGVRPALRADRALPRHRAVHRLDDGFIVVWLAWNVFAPATARFDPYPFILLTLILSLQASYAAPLILLAQNRQADRDRVSLEQDRARTERPIADTEYLTREIAALRVALGEVATRDFIRSELRDLLEELEERRPAGAGRRRRRRGDRRRAGRHPSRPAPRQARPAGDVASRPCRASPSTQVPMPRSRRSNDPEIHRPITELGMVKSVEIDADGVGRGRRCS